MTRSAPLALLLALSLSACDLFTGPGGPDGAPAPITELPRALTLHEQRVLGASNAFGFDLLEEFVGAEPGASHFLSPLSASMALGMTMNGAGGETWEAMRRTLRFGDLTEEEINASYRGLIDLLADLDARVSFQLANSIWHDRSLTPLEPFVARVDEAFDAEVRPLDFGAADAASTINAWVRDATKGRIEAIVPDPIPPGVVMYLLNAIHFKGDWTDRFDPELTREGDFRLADGSTARVRYMRREAGFDVYEHADFVALDLPYGGQAFSMTVLLPHDPAGLPDLVASLDDALWAEVEEGLGEVRADAELLLPRFTLEWRRSLKDALASLGMGIAFTGDADLSRMIDPALGGAPRISEVLQKTFVKVDEEGTEAAAVTSVEVRVVSASPGYAVDRPFVVAIRERLSGTILFLGAIAEAPVDG
jgi:serpin B